MALANGQSFHLAALLWRRGKLVRIGINGRVNRSFKRYYGSGSTCSESHAEMDALLYAEPGDYLEVIRWSAKGERTMAKPCRFCQAWIKRIPLSRVRYTNAKGEWEYLP